MSKDTKIWKPGQLVTIDDKVYRVKKDRFGCVCCENVYTEPFLPPCCVCIAHKHPLRTVYKNKNWTLKELKPNK